MTAHVAGRPGPAHRAAVDATRHHSVAAPRAQSTRWLVVQTTHQQPVSAGSDEHPERMIVVLVHGMCPEIQGRQRPPGSTGGPGRLAGPWLGHRQARCGRAVVHCAVVHGDSRVLDTSPSSPASCIASLIGQHDHGSDRSVEGGPRAPGMAQALLRDNPRGGLALGGPATHPSPERLLRNIHRAPAISCGACLTLSLMVSKTTRMDGTPELVPEVRPGARGCNTPLASRIGHHGRYGALPNTRTRPWTSDDRINPHQPPGDYAGRAGLEARGLGPAAERRRGSARALRAGARQDALQVAAWRSAALAVACAGGRGVDRRVGAPDHPGGPGMARRRCRVRLGDQRAGVALDRGRELARGPGGDRRWEHGAADTSHPAGCRGVRARP